MNVIVVTDFATNLYISHVPDPHFPKNMVSCWNLYPWPETLHTVIYQISPYNCDFRVTMQTCWRNTLPQFVQ